MREYDIQFSHKIISHLLQPVSDKEIEQGLFSIPPDKVAGPDGMPAKFYGTFLLSQEYVLEEMNHTLIVLIPKREQQLSVLDFRPISLANVGYNASAKVLVDRLQPVLSAVVSSFQNAFIEGRNISDNILLATMLVHTMKRRKGKKPFWGSLKVDIRKAYDTMLGIPSASSST